MNSFFKNNPCLGLVLWCMGQAVVYSIGIPKDHWLESWLLQFNPDPCSESKKQEDRPCLHMRDLDEAPGFGSAQLLWLSGD